MEKCEKCGAEDWIHPGGDLFYLKEKLTCAKCNAKEYEDICFCCCEYHDDPSECLCPCYNPAIRDQE